MTNIAFGQEKTAEQWFEIGLRQGTEKKYSEAIKSYAECVKTKEYESCFFNRGNIYRYLEKYDEAIRDYSKAIEINPRSAVAYSNRAGTYDYLKQYDKAYADYTKAIEV